MSRAFYDLCYDQYKLEAKSTEALYQRAGIMLISLPVLGAAASALGRADLVLRCFTRIDIFLHLLGAAAAFVSLVVSAVFLFLCVCPRREYKSLADLDSWLKWRDSHLDYLKKQGGDGATPADASIEAAMIEEMCPKLAGAQSKNAAINEKRRACFRVSVLWLGLCLGAIGVEGLFYFLLKVQGI
jgi:hypothetical protein